jgi:hypothetical protein
LNPARQLPAAEIIKGWCAREISAPEPYLRDHWHALEHRLLLAVMDHPVA